MVLQDFSFSQKTALQQLKSASDIFDQLKKDDLNSELADRLAENLWKCTDYFHRESLCKCTSNNLKTCQEKFRKDCKALGAINDVSDSSKHSGIDRKKCTLQDVSLHTGGLSKGFDFGFDITGFKVVHKDSKIEIYFMVIVEEAIVYLRGLLKP